MIRKFFQKNDKLIFILMITWGLYFGILWPKMLYFDELGNLTAGWRIVWADWAMHIGQTLSFYFNHIGEVFSSHPLYEGISLKYSFGINLLSALMMKIGINFIPAMILPMLFFSWFLLIALVYFLKKLTKDNREVFWTITLFLASGGLGFIYFLKDLGQDFSWQKFIYPPQEYTRIDDLDYYWYNTIVANFIPQRGSLPGMSLGLLFLGTLFGFYKKEFKGRKMEIKLFSLGILIGLLSFIHIHTLLLIFLICLVLAVSDLKNWRKWFYFALGAIIGALPFIIGFRIWEGESKIRFYPGWLANKNALNISVIIFWLKNWGLIIPLSVISMFLFKFDKKVKTFILSFALVFLVCNLFIFQAYDWDNSKLLLWVYLIFAFLISKLLIFIWDKNGKRFWYFNKILVVALFLSLTLSGTLDLVRILNTSKQSFVMVSKEELELAKTLRENSSWKDITLISDNHLNFVSVASGRRVLMGYTGWLWSWGIPVDSRKIEEFEVFSGGQNAKKVIEKYSIDFVVIDNNAREKFFANDEFFEKNYEKIAEKGQYKIYKL